MIRRCSVLSVGSPVPDIDPRRHGLLPAEAVMRSDRRDGVERAQFAVVELEANPGVAAAGAAEGVAGAVERISERDFGVALADDAECCAGSDGVRADVVAVDEEERLLAVAVPRSPAHPYQQRQRLAGVVV